MVKLPADLIEVWSVDYLLPKMLHLRNFTTPGDYGLQERNPRVVLYLDGEDPSLSQPTEKTHFYKHIHYLFHVILSVFVFKL